MLYYIKKNNKHIIDVYTTLLICYIILSKITSTYLMYIPLFLYVILY